MNCEQFLFTRSVLFVSHLSKHKHRWPGDCLCKYFAILTTMGRCEFCLFADKLCIWSFAFFHLLLATCYLLAASGWWLATHLASPVGAPPPSAPISNVWPTIKANQPASQPAVRVQPASQPAVRVASQPASWRAVGRVALQQFSLFWFLQLFCFRLRCSLLAFGLLCVTSLHM